jgi:hypothetical protein
LADVVHAQVVAVQVAVLPCVEAQALAGWLLELRGRARHLLSNSKQRGGQRHTRCLLLDAAGDAGLRRGVRGLRRESGEVVGDVR